MSLSSFFVTASLALGRVGLRWLNEQNREGNVTDEELKMADEEGDALERERRARADSYRNQ